MGRDLCNNQRYEEEKGNVELHIGVDWSSGKWFEV
jgi:hypothetical protein